MQKLPAEAALQAQGRSRTPSGPGQALGWPGAEQTAGEGPLLCPGRLCQQAGGPAESRTKGSEGRKLPAAQSRVEAVLGRAGAHSAPSSPWAQRRSWRPQFPGAPPTGACQAFYGSPWSWAHASDPIRVPLRFSHKPCHLLLPPRPGPPLGLWVRARQGWLCTPGSPGESLPDQSGPLARSLHTFTSFRN